MAKPQLACYLRPRDNLQPLDDGLQRPTRRVSAFDLTVSQAGTYAMSLRVSAAAGSGSFLICSDDGQRMDLAVDTAEGRNEARGTCEVVLPASPKTRSFAVFINGFFEEPRLGPVLIMRRPGQPPATGFALP